MQVSAAAFHTSRHLDEQQLLPADPHCPFCNSKNRERIADIQADPEVVLLRCDGCQACSVSRLPTADALADYYSGYYTNAVGGERAEPEITFDQHERFGKHLGGNWLRNGGRGRESLRVLDFGGGDGTLAHATAEVLIRAGVRQVDIEVVEHQTELLSPEDERITIVGFDTLEEVSGQFDIVIASAIVEHLATPRTDLDRLLDLLAPGGMFYARTPYIVPLMRCGALFGIRWDFTFPAHLHDLGQSFWEGWFAQPRTRHDFQVVGSHPSIVETTFSRHFTRTLASRLLKAPWYILGRYYGLVGGWEIFVKRQ